MPILNALVFLGFVIFAFATSYIYNSMDRPDHKELPYDQESCGCNGNCHHLKTLEKQEEIKTKE
jgi:hypothetical protein